MLKLTTTDYFAIEEKDYNYINDKGAKAYALEDYATAIEYYRLGAAMGSVHSIANLGYCYMYARSIPKNMDLAMAYFRLAAAKNDIDALYKLGNIYKNGANGVQTMSCLFIIICGQSGRLKILASTNIFIRACILALQKNTCQVVVCAVICRLLICI